MDRAGKALCKVPCQDNSTLTYLIRDDVKVPAITNNLIPGKYCSKTHRLFVEEIVALKFHSISCVETVKVALFDFLEKALLGSLLKSAVQSYEATKDGKVVMKSMFVQRGRKSKWKKAHKHLTSLLGRK